MEVNLEGTRVGSQDSNDVCDYPALSSDAHDSLSHRKDSKSPALGSQLGLFGETM